MDGIHENFWVWGTEELIRYWRDFLQPGTRHIINACDTRAHPGWEDFREGAFDKPNAYASYWSLLRMKLLVLEQPEKDRAEYMRKRAHYTLWIGPDGTSSLAHLLAVLKNGYEYKRILPAPVIEPKFIQCPTALGGNGWIDGGGPWLYSPKVKGLGMYQASFAPPKIMDNKWDMIQNSIFAGFHRAWSKDAEIEIVSIACGNVQVHTCRAK